MPLAMSIFGGIAKTASQGWRSWRRFISDICVSAFAGFMVHLFLVDVALSEGIKAALVGMSGFSGVLVLEGLTTITLKLLSKVTGQEFTQKWDGIERRKASEPGHEERRGKRRG